MFVLIVCSILKCCLLLDNILSGVILCYFFCRLVFEDVLECLFIVNSNNFMWCFYLYVIFINVLLFYGFFFKDLYFYKFEIFDGFNVWMGVG